MRCNAAQAMHMQNAHAHAHAKIQMIRRDLYLEKTKQFSGQHGLVCVQNQNIFKENGGRQANG